MADYNGSSDMSSGFDDGGITSFLFYSFVLNPICVFILSPARKWKRSTAMYVVVGLISLIAFFNLYVNLADSGPNYYQILEVTRSSKVLDIRKSYKRLVLEIHPDKNSDPAAPDQFAKVKAAYDVLIDTEQREIYNKLGAGAVKSQAVFNEMDQFFVIGIYYLINASLTYLVTIGRRNEKARTWTFCGLIFMFAAELALTLGGVDSGLPDLPSWVLPTLPHYDIVQIMHSIYPAFLNGCRLVSSAIFVDIEVQIRAMLVQLLKGHSMLILQLRTIEMEIGKLRNNGTHVERRSGGVKIDDVSSSSTPNFDSVTSKLLEIEREDFFKKSDVNKLIGDISTSDKSRFSIPFSNFWVFLALYAAYFYFTDK